MTLDREAPRDLRIRRQPRVDLSGRLYGRLRVLEFLGFSKSAWCSYWLCLCNCGRRVAVSQKAMVRTNGPTSSCGCLGAEKASIRSWRGHGELSQNFWTHIRNHAIERDLVFEISIEQAWSLFLRQDGKCAISGLSISMGRHRPGRRIYGTWPRLGTASLDRKDSNQGYVADNIQWVHKEVNRMKGAMKEEEFIALCGKIADINRARTNQHPAWRPEAGI